MPSLIITVIFIVAIVFTAVSLVRFVRRRQNADPNIQYIEYYQYSVWVILLPTTILSIISLYRIFAIPEELLLDEIPLLHEMKVYGDNTSIFLMMSTLLAFIVCALANEEILCDEKAITLHTFLWKERRLPYADILFADYDTHQIWFPTTYGAFKLYCDDASYIEYYPQPQKCKKPFEYINNQYYQLFGKNIPQKQPDSDWNQGRWIAVAVGNSRRSGEIHIQHPPIGKWRYLCMLIPLAVCIIIFFLSFLFDDNYYEVTFTEYYIEACDNDCLVYLISPDLDAPVFLGYGSSWAASYGETLTYTTINGQRHYENFGEDLEIILSKCDGKELFDMYANYVKDESSAPYRYKEYYDPYYLSDPEWIYIDNDSNGIYFFLGSTTVIMIYVYYVFYYKPRKRNQNHEETA